MTILKWLQACGVLASHRRAAGAPVQALDDQASFEQVNGASLGYDDFRSSASIGLGPASRSPDDDDFAETRPGCYSNSYLLGDADRRTLVGTLRAA